MGAERCRVSAGLRPGELPGLIHLSLRLGDRGRRETFPHDLAMQVAFDRIRHPAALDVVAEDRDAEQDGSDGHAPRWYDP